MPASGARRPQRLLLRGDKGMSHARDQLVPLVYQELRRRAAAYLQPRARGLHAAAHRARP